MDSATYSVRSRERHEAIELVIGTLVDTHDDWYQLDVKSYSVDGPMPYALDPVILESWENDDSLPIWSVYIEYSPILKGA